MKKFGRSIFGRFGVIGISSLFVLSLAVASTVKQADPLASTKQKMRQLILDCQLPDGSFAMKSDGTQRVEPYFATTAAIALLSIGDPSTFDSVANYIAWHTSKINPDGTVDVYQLGVSQGRPLQGDDSDAANYLTLCSRYVEKTHRALPTGTTAKLELAFRAMLRYHAKNGMTYPVKPAYNYSLCLMQDNIEVYSGCVAASKLFGPNGPDSNPSLYNFSLGEIDLLKKALLLAYNRDKRLYSSAWDAYNSYSVTSKTGDPNHYLGLEGLTSLFALICVNWLHPECWQFVTETMKPDGFVLSNETSNVCAPQCPVEWFFLASVRENDPWAIKKYLKRTIDNASLFNDGNIYLERPSWVLLALDSYDPNAQKPWKNVWFYNINDDDKA